MSYSELYLRPQTRRPPMILVSLAVVVVLGAMAFFFSSSITPTRASKKKLKQQEVVNLSSRQIGIFWESEQADVGWVLYGDSASNVTSIALDEQDSTQQKEKRRYHSVVLKNVQPETTYYYQIISDNEVITGQNGEPFTVKTPHVADSLPSLKPAYGKVVGANGQAAANVLILVRYPNAYTLLTRTSTSGEWLLPLQTLVDKTTGQSVVVGEKSTVAIDMVNDEAQTHIESLFSRLSPLSQTIILGKNYTFLQPDQVLPAFSQRVTPVEYPVEVRYPKEGAVIPGVRPLINGVGVPGKNVVVNINSVPPFSAKVMVDQRKEWKVTIPNSIQPGTYRLVVTTEDAHGRKLGFKRRFSLTKSGESVVLGESVATPSATLTPRTTGTRTPTPSPTTGRAAAPTPTSALTATVGVTQYVYQPTATPIPPTSGVASFLPYVVAGCGFIILGAGLVLLF